MIQRRRGQVRSEVVATATASGPGPAPRHGRWRVSSLAYGLLLPATIALLIALAYPLGRQVVLSFQTFGLAQQFGAAPEWVGLDNYSQLVRDPYLWTVVGRSLLFCFVNAILTLFFGGLIALLMSRMSKPIRIAVQCAMLLAWAMPVVAAMTVFQFLFDTQYGVINWTLTHLGLDFENHAWLLHPMSFFAVATTVVVWMSIPFVAFTIYAALTQVPDEIVEAAEIDGATGGQRLRHVVLPLVQPVLIVVLLLQIIWDLRVFTQIYTLQRAGGVAHETNLLGTYIYRLGIGGGDFGMAAAIAMFMLLLTVILTAPYVRMMLAQEED